MKVGNKVRKILINRKKILATVEECLGLEVNDSKNRYNDCRNGAVNITGISVDGTGKVRLSQKTIEKWRGVIYRAMISMDEKQIKTVHGIITYVIAVYGKDSIPSQLAKPYKRLMQRIHFNKGGYFFE